MRHVQLSEDDRQLATLVGEVEAGESVTILRGERPVAQIIPFPEANEPTPAERTAALEPLTGIMDKSIDSGGFRIEDRGALFDRHSIAEERREAAIRRLDEIMSEGIPLGGTPPSRDEMHDGR